MNNNEWIQGLLTHRLCGLAKEDNYERPIVTIQEAESGDYPCVTDGPNKASFWLCTEQDGDDINLFSLSSFPYPYPDEETAISNPQIVPQHIIDLEIDELGLEELMDIKDLQTFLNDEGLRIGQPFKIDMSIYYYQCGGYDCREWDSNVEYKISKN